MMQAQAPEQATLPLYEDETCYCENCGISYVWTAEEQRTRTNGTGKSGAATADRQLENSADVPASDGQASTTQDAERSSVTDSTDQTPVFDDTESANTDAQMPRFSSSRSIAQLSTSETSPEIGPPLYCPGCRQIIPAAGRQRGLVKWYNRRRGYGFITRHEADDLYVHRSALRRGHLAPDDLVEFAVGENRRGAVAAHVRILDRADGT